MLSPDWPPRMLLKESGLFQAPFCFLPDAVSHNRFQVRRGALDRLAHQETGRSDLDNIAYDLGDIVGNPLFATRIALHYGDGRAASACTADPSLSPARVASSSSGRSGTSRQIPTRLRSYSCQHAKSSAAALGASYHTRAFVDPMPRRWTTAGKSTQHRRIGRGCRKTGSHRERELLRPVRRICIGSILCAAFQVGVWRDGRESRRRENLQPLD